MLTRDEKKRAIKRVEEDGAIRLFDLALRVHLPVAALERYVARGKGGVHLDGVVVTNPRTKERHWFSSVKAWERFQAALEARAEATAPA